MSEAKPRPPFQFENIAVPKPELSRFSSDGIEGMTDQQVMNAITSLMRMQGCEAPPESGDLTSVAMKKILRWLYLSMAPK